MSTDPGQAQPLTSLPTLEELPRSPGGGYEPDGVRAAFDGFRPHVLQLQAQLRVLQAAGRTANVARAQEGAEKLLTAAGLGPEAAGEVATAIIDAAQSMGEARRPSSLKAAAPEAPAAPQAPAPTEAQDEGE